MKNYTNLNIRNNEYSFNYLAEYEDKAYFNPTPSYIQDGDDIIFLSAGSNIKQKYNSWEEITGEGVKDKVPQNTDMASINLIIPQHNIMNYETKCKYALTVSTFIAGKQVVLYSGILDPLDTKAREKGMLHMLENSYYEYINVQFIDPSYLIYNDAWKSFREDVCGEPAQSNNLGSNLMIVFSAIENVDGGLWGPFTGYNVCQSALALDQEPTNMMGASLSFDQFQYNIKLYFNEAYEQTSAGFKEYLFETYDLDPSVLKMCITLFVHDSDDAYKMIMHSKSSLIVDDVFTKQEFDFKSWNEYKTGLMLSSVIAIQNQDGEDIIELTSNEMPLNEEQFKFLINDGIINNVNLDQVNMNNVQINAVNKIVQKVITVERPDDYKANIQKPVFIHTNNSSTILIHPSVNENITLNLDAYKNKVNMFTLKIGTSCFNEIGRVNQGVIFKITGNTLDSDITDGIYYVLDDNDELVTTGKYKVAS